MATTLPPVGGEPVWVDPKWNSEENMLNMINEANDCHYLVGDLRWEISPADEIGMMTNITVHGNTPYIRGSFTNVYRRCSLLALLRAYHNYNENRLFMNSLPKESEAQYLVRFFNTLGIVSDAVEMELVEGAIDDAEVDSLFRWRIRPLTESWLYRPAEWVEVIGLVGTPEELLGSKLETSRLLAYRDRNLARD